MLYFTEEQVADFNPDFSFLDETMASDLLPIGKPTRLSFTPTEDYIGTMDARGQHSQGVRQRILLAYPQIEDELEDVFHGKFSGNGHKMGGYAFFTQHDSRSGNAGLDGYELLLQIDSDDNIMWGDMGVANFFIHPTDLAKKDFSKVLFTWDCY